MGDIRRASADQTFDAWIAAINQACGHFHADTRTGSFIGRLHAFEAGPLRASLVEANLGTRIYTTQADVLKGDSGKFFTVLQLRGSCSIAQDDATTVLAPGDIAMVDAARPCAVDFFDESQQISLILPRQAVERNLRSTRIRCAQRVQASTSVASLARRLMVGAVRQTRTGLSPQEGEATLDALVHLLRPAIGAPALNDSGQGKLQRALDFIDRHIDTEDLGPERIAQATGVSVRGLYRLFATQGLVVAQYIRNRRLDLCADALRQQDCAQKLAAVGYTWGFSDSSHFSTAFKLRFGVSPGEYRRRHATSH